MMETYLNKLRAEATEENKSMVEANIKKLRSDISAEVNFYRALELSHTTNINKGK